VANFVGFTIAGLALGAVLAAGAVGLVLTYSTTGVFNFAHGAIGMFGAFTYWELRFNRGWPAPLAVAAVLLVVAPAIGAALELGLMRRLRDANEATKLVVTISLLTAFIGLATWIWPPAVARPTKAFFPGTTFDVLDVRVSADELLSLGAAGAAAAGLWLFLRRHRLGVAMRATVDDPDLLSLNGGRTLTTGVAAWVIGCSLAALSGIFFVGPLGLDPTILSLLIVDSYAAAIIGRLRSLPVTFAAALALGLVQSWLLGYLPVDQTWSRFVDSQFVSALPAIVLIVALLVLRPSRLRSATVAVSREIFPIPTLRGGATFVAAVVAAAVLLPPIMTDANTLNLGLVFAYAVIALSLVPLTGFAGQVSLAQFSLAGIGAVVMAHVGDGGNLVGFVLAGLVAAGVGALIALPALRLSGVYLALATGGFAVLMDRWLWRFPAFTVPGTDLEVAIFGSGSLSVPRLAPFGLDTADTRSQTVVAGIVFALAAGGVLWLRRSTFGRRLLAMKSSEAGCATVGMSLVRTKVAVFALSAGIAGLGGALLGGLRQSVDTTTFGFTAGLVIFVLAVVGGLGSPAGSIIAAVGVVVLPLTSTWPLLSSVSWWPNLIAITPALLGIQLGREPNGLRQRFHEDFLPLWRDPAAIGGVLVGGVALYTLVRAGLIGGWLFAVALAVVVVAANTWAKRAGLTGGATGAEEGLVPLEWAGIERPLSAEQLLELERQMPVREVDRAPA